MPNFTKIATLTGAALALSVTLTVAAGHEAFENRKAAMKVVGGSTKTIGDMLKGTTDLDPAKANEAFAAMQAAVAPFGDLFPEGSDAPTSEAGPAIWTDRAGFDATLAAFEEDIAAAVAAAPQDQASIAAAFGAVAENCKTCHQSYRVKK